MFGNSRRAIVGRELQVLGSWDHIVDMAFFILPFGLMDGPTAA